jgi:starch phosphorylase
VTPKEARQRIVGLLSDTLSTSPQSATKEQYFQAVAIMVQDLLQKRHRSFLADCISHAKKQVHYLSLEFLPGRLLRNNLFNLGLTDTVAEALEIFGVNLDELYELEPDVGLGNGGLGRLAACYLDAIATGQYWGKGYCILYEFGIFSQRIVDGWQTELPDHWLPKGQVWLSARPEQAIEVRFGGTVISRWENTRHFVEHSGYTTVTAVPYDMFVPGYDAKAVSVLRLYKAQSPGVDMEKFNSGDYLGAFGATAIAETISKVLYPNDSHLEGKKLRLKQQYFLSAAALGDIIRAHLNTYGSLGNLAEKNAIALNDTHPVLAIPELMRVLLDDFGYDWQEAFDICRRMFSYTNHTMMSEALEEWNEELVRELLPRIFSVIAEINERFCRMLRERFGCDDLAISRMAPLAYGRVRMANLAVAVCHSINGVSSLHSRLITEKVFPDYHKVAPYKFKNVTNGIAARRWLCQANPALTELLCETIGSGFIKDFSRLERLKDYADDPAVLHRVAQIKRENKRRLFGYIQKSSGISLPDDSICHVQVKRLHEYKRQHLNALHIIDRYLNIKASQGRDSPCSVFIFGAKAAPGYYLAKQIIKLIHCLSRLLEKDPLTRERLRVVFLEDYRVTLSEIIMPAADFSHQLSLAGTEASGTGNMKMMLNGAITVGTADGANIEISQAAGSENVILFGMNSEEVGRLRQSGYEPGAWLSQDAQLAAAVDALISGELGDTFRELYEALRYVDSYMAVADYDSYRDAMLQSDNLYSDRMLFAKKSLINTSGSGIFVADRAATQYAEQIWGL